MRPDSLAEHCWNSMTADKDLGIRVAHVIRFSGFLQGLAALGMVRLRSLQALGAKPIDHAAGKSSASFMWHSHT